MGRLMTERGYVPEAIVSSPAARAKETAELVCAEIAPAAPISLDERIYEAAPRHLLEVISDIDTAGSAMIVGHNPGMEALVKMLTGRDAEMPTAALAVVELSIDDWGSVSPGCGQLIDVIRPKEARR